MDDRPEERRKIAMRACVWTVVGLIGILSGIFLVRGIVIGMSDPASQTAAVAAILSAIVAATMYGSRLIESTRTSYRQGYQEGFADGRRVSVVVPFPQDNGDRVR